MSTGEETLLTSNAVKEGAFSSPGGGGMTFGGNFSPDGRINDSDENEEQFRRASDSMFKEGNDFMSNTDNAWIQPAGNNQNTNNPFLPDIGMTRKPDSGFISPACNSSNKSSDEDRKEDEEFLESQEVSKLLGGRPMEELLSRDTPTPPVDETGSSLEEILAAARDNPDSVGEVDDDDSDESSTDDPKPLPLKGSNSNQPANQNVSDSDEENDEGDFTFVKEESQVKNLLADIHGDAGKLENSSKPSELSNGHHQDNEDEGEGPSSVIIESQETPNPDSASFILKTMNSEAPELPSPQEPIVEVIMEGVGKASPIFEEVEEEDRHSLPSPQCNKTGKEISELECGEETEPSSVSFQCKDDDANFVLKTPNPADSTHASEDVNQQPKTEESDCEPQFPKHAKDDEEEIEKDNVVSDHPQEGVEEIIEEMIEAQHVASIGTHSLPPPVHMESENKPKAIDEDLKVDGENKDQSHKTEISSDGEAVEAENKKDIISDDIIADAPVSPEPQPLVDIAIPDVNVETTHDEHPKPTDIAPGKSEVVNELIQFDDQKDEEVKEDARLQEEVVEPIIEAKSKVEVTASVEEHTEAVQKEVFSPLEGDKIVEPLPEAIKPVESLPEADKAIESLPEADKAVEALPTALESIEKITEEVVGSSSKTSEKVVASAPTSKGGSPKKEAKAISKKPIPSTTKSASSSPKKTLSGSTAPSSAKSTLNRRPASATKTAPSVSKTTPKTVGAPTASSKLGSATRTQSATKPSVGAASKTMASSSRPSTTKSTTNSTLTKKPLSTTSSRTTSATSSTLRSARPASGEVKSKVDSAPKREPLSKVGSKPISRVGSVTKPSAAASQSKSNGTTAATASTTRKPISSRTTPTSSTLSKRTTPSSDSGSRVTSTKSGTTVRSTITSSSRTATSSSTTKAAGGTLTKRPTNVSARVSTGLSRPKSSSSASVKATAKPTENGATTSPKASPVNGNDVTPSKETVP